MNVKKLADAIYDFAQALHEADATIDVTAWGSAVAIASLDNLNHAREHIDFSQPITRQKSRDLAAGFKRKVRSCH